VTENSRTDHCGDCGAALQGRYCHQCGQDSRISDRVPDLLREGFAEWLGTDSRALRTLALLISRPGHLSLEHRRGRRQRYLPPLRLYLVTSLAFALLLALQNLLAPEDPVVRPSAAADSPAAAAPAPAAFKDGLTRIHVPWIPADHAARIRQVVSEQAGKLERLIAEDPSELTDALIEALPPLIFLLLPLFALLLKLAYLGSGRLYTQHLVLAAHGHSFVFLAFSLELTLHMLGRLGAAPVTGWLEFLASCWIPLYLLLSMRRYYGEGALRTCLKFAALSVSYAVLLALAVLLAMVRGFFSL
jgi:hypothetical protein